MCCFNILIRDIENAELRRHKFTCIVSAGEFVELISKAVTAVTDCDQLGANQHNHGNLMMWLPI